MQIKILDDALDDISKGVLFYEKQKIGLGNYFLDTIMSDIESLQIYHGVHIKIKNYYRLLSKRFPYSIYYKYSEDKIFIYAVLDCRQNPITIGEQLK